MFQAIIQRAQQSVDSLVTKYVTRLVVVVPFLVAAGFGTAAAALKLTEVYGSIQANTIMAIAFAAFGLLGAAIIAAGSRSTVDAVPAEAEPEPATHEAAAPPAAASAELALTALGALGPTALTSLLRLLARNLPLVAGVLVVAYLLLSEAAQRSAETVEPAE